MECQSLVPVARNTFINSMQRFGSQQFAPEAPLDEGERAINQDTQSIALRPPTSQATNQLDKVDWLCNNEVALYHHAYMLNSIVKRSPESNYRSTTVSLTTQIMETCEEEVTLYMASPKFLRPLDNSPDMSTTRLNKLTRGLIEDTMRILLANPEVRKCVWAGHDEVSSKESGYSGDGRDKSSESSVQATDLFSHQNRDTCSAVSECSNRSENALHQGPNKG